MEMHAAARGGKRSGWCDRLEVEVNRSRRKMAGVVAGTAMKAGLAQLNLQLEARLTAFERARVEYVAQVTSMDRAARGVYELLQEIARVTHGEIPIVQGPYRVIENGEVRYVSLDEARRVMNSSEADLILDLSGRRLRYVRMSREGRKSTATWAYAPWPICKVLRVGLSRPGVAFGNLTLTESSRGASVTCRSLSRYMADITKLIQGGGTNGPYVRHVSGDHEESESGRAYLFDDRWHYLVVERVA